MVVIAAPKKLQKERETEEKVGKEEKREEGCILSGPLDPMPLDAPLALLSRRVNINTHLPHQYYCISGNFREVFIFAN